LNEPVESREHANNAFVSIKGSDYRWLKQALERGDLPLVKASAAQLPSVDLPTALDIGCSSGPRAAQRRESSGATQGILAICAVGANSTARAVRC
jgi:hypothetical protein